MNWGGLTLYLSQFACGGYDKVVVVVMTAANIVIILTHHVLGTALSTLCILIKSYSRL